MDYEVNIACKQLANIINMYILHGMELPDKQ